MQYTNKIYMAVLVVVGIFWAFLPWFKRENLGINAIWVLGCAMILLTVHPTSLNSVNGFCLNEHWRLNNRSSMNRFLDFPSSAGRTKSPLSYVMDSRLLSSSFSSLPPCSLRVSSAPPGTFRAATRPFGSSAGPLKTLNSCHCRNDPSPLAL